MPQGYPAAETPDTLLRSHHKPRPNYLEKRSGPMIEHEMMELSDAPDGNESELSDPETDIDEILSNNKKIPKPPGQPGRPHSGSYTLETMIKAWGKELINEVK
jgi:hypothetical protein